MDPMMMALLGGGGAPPGAPPMPGMGGPPGLPPLPGMGGPPGMPPMPGMGGPPPMNMMPPPMPPPMPGGSPTLELTGDIGKDLIRMGVNMLNMAVNYLPPGSQESSMIQGVLRDLSALASGQMGSPMPMGPPRTGNNPPPFPPGMGPSDVPPPMGGGMGPGLPMMPPM